MGPIQGRYRGPSEVDTGSIRGQCGVHPRSIRGPSEVNFFVDGRPSGANLFSNFCGRRGARGPARRAPAAAAAAISEKQMTSARPPVKKEIGSGRPPVDKKLAPDGYPSRTKRRILSFRVSQVALWTSRINAKKNRTNGKFGGRRMDSFLGVTINA